MDWEQLPLSRARVDRDAERRRRPGLVAELLRDPATRALLVHRGRVATRATDGAGPALDLVAPGALPAADDGRWCYLGADARGAGYLARLLDDDADPDAIGIEGVPLASPDAGLVAGRTWSALRDMGELLDAADAGLATTAVALAAWHERNPRCPRCGEPTVVEQAGWVRRCPNDSAEHYPRTDPAIIVAVVDDEDRLLLARATQWPGRRFSTLAGFVEAGESAEAAVRREVREEVDVQLAELAYRGSQPWPFPGSLMLAYRARARTTALRVDGEEIAEARWFRREELRAEIEAGTVLMPMRSSIARALIEEWLGGPVPERATAPAS